jgi:ABC-2 type transport system permease protein
VPGHWISGWQSVKSPVAQSALANVVSLGVSFITRRLRRAALLSETVLKIASFTRLLVCPATDAIRSLSGYGFSQLAGVFGAMLIQLGFAAAFVVIALVTAKQKRRSGRECGNREKRPFES